MSAVLDANSWYGKTKIGKYDREKAAFTSQHGLYRFKGIGYEVNNASATFQKAVDVALATVCWQPALVY